MRHWWKCFCLQMRWLFREPYDVEGNHALVREIDECCT